MSIVYRGKEIIRLNRILGIVNNKPVIYLNCPSEKALQEQNKDLTVFQNNFFIQFPLEGKVKAKDIDMVRPPTLSKPPDQLTVDDFREVLKQYALLANSIEYEPENTEK